MCGRYSITLPPEAIRQIFQTYGELPNWPAYYNAAPTTALPVVRQAKDDGMLQERPLGKAINNVKNDAPAGRDLSKRKHEDCYRKKHKPCANNEVVTTRALAQHFLVKMSSKHRPLASLFTIGNMGRRSAMRSDLAGGPGKAA